MSFVKAGLGKSDEMNAFFMETPKGHQILSPRDKRPAARSPTERPIGQNMQYFLFFHNFLFSSFFLFFHQFSVFEAFKLRVAGAVTR